MKKDGYEVIQADCGEKAIEMVAEESPDLVLLDIMMPGISGFEVCEQLNSDPHTQELPVVLLTALSQREDIEKGAKVGADEFLTKPFNVFELLTRIRTLLKIHDLNRFLKKHDSLLEQFGKLSSLFVKTKTIDKSSYEIVLRSMLEENLRDVSGLGKGPSGVYIALSMQHFSVPGTYYRRTENGIESRGMELKISPEQLKTITYERKGFLISNWRSAARSIEAYNQELPAEMVTQLGVIENFLYFKDEAIECLFINFNRDIQPFDVSLFHHLVYYNKTFMLILQQLSAKEQEYEILAESLSRMTELKDDSKGRHYRIKQLVSLLCDRLETSQGFKTQLMDAVSLYDIGKLLIDQKILFKRRTLSDEEWELIRRIPEHVSTILGDNPRMAMVKELAANIYEHWDGSGYPNQRKGGEIPLSARIVSITNVYDSLRCPRSYRQAFSHADAMKILVDGDERVQPSHFDPKILSIFSEIAPEVEELYDGVFTS